MNIAIDISPLEKGHYLQHRVRGTGFYIERLRRTLLKYYSQHSYTFFTRGEKLPEATDIVHYPYFEPFFLTLPLINRVKTVVTVHDLTPLVFPEHFPAGLKGGLKWRIQKRALQKADIILADSLASKKDIVKYAGVLAERITVVYLAVGEEFIQIKDRASVKAQLKKKYNLPDKFVLYVGDATWNKNLVRLVTAVKKLRIPLVLVGQALEKTDFDRNNPWNSDLAEIERLITGEKNFMRLGFVPMQDLVRLYNMASALTMPSLYEGFGLPVLEAMSCGCPVVCTKQGSLDEVVGSAAMTVDAYDVDSIIEGINKVYNDLELQTKLAALGFNQSKKFTWKKTAEETLRMYEKVI